MRAKRGIINVDKLRLSFVQPQKLWDELKKHPIDKPTDPKKKPKYKYVPYEGFKIEITDDGRGQDNKKEPIKIVANVIMDDNTKLGTFTFNNSAKYDGLCFFTFENKALYTTDIIIHGEKSNKMCYLQPIADALGLAINSFTEIELAADINHNPLPIIRKMIKDYDIFDMIVNRKLVIDKERTIEDYAEMFSRSRKKLNRYPTIYIKQAKKDGQKLRIYNKSQEIMEESGKKYIDEWDDFGSAEIYRLEVSVKWENFKKWIDYLQTAAHLPSEWQRHPTETITEHLERTLWLLQNPDYRLAMWYYSTEKMLYFVHRRTNTPITLADIGAEGKTLLDGLK